jgi:hypothetical protein
VVNGSRLVAGRQIVGLLRATECGHWYLTVHGEGRLGGGLLIDPALASDTAGLVEEVDAVRAIGLPGVQAIADLVEQDGQVWLLTDTPPGPTVRELLDAGPSRGLDGGSAATLLNETAQTLLALHRSDVVHGGFGPSTVVVAPDGKAAQIEVALATAVGLRSVTPGDDVRDWARLAIQLAGVWCSGANAEMVTRAATVADRADLAEARQVLLAGRDLLPPDFLDRRPLVSAASQWAAFMEQHARSAVGGLADAVEAPTTARSLLAPGSSAASAPGQLTRPVEAMLSASPSGSGPSGPTQADPAQADPEYTDPTPETDRRMAPAFQASTMVPPAENPGPDADATQVELRPAARQPGGPPRVMDPPPPSAPPAARPMWRDEPTARPVRQMPDHTADPRFRDQGPPPGPRSPWRLIAAVAGVAALLAAGLFWWLQRDDNPELAISGVTVRPVEGPVGCDAQVDVVGVIATNGGEGEVHYRWVRNGEETGEIFRVTVQGETETEVTLRWTFTGRGTFEAAARLEVLEPSAATGEAAFTYACE